MTLSCCSSLNYLTCTSAHLHIHPRRRPSEKHRLIFIILNKGRGRCTLLRAHAHARSHARLFICKHCRYARACCETRQPSPSAGGRAPSGSPAERSGGGVNRATKICCTNLSCDSTANRRVQIRFKAAGHFGSYTYLLCHAELNSEP